MSLDGYAALIQYREVFPFWDGYKNCYGRTSPFRGTDMNLLLDVISVAMDGWTLHVGWCLCNTDFDTFNVRWQGAVPTKHTILKCIDNFRTIECVRPRTAQGYPFSNYMVARNRAVSTNVKSSSTFALRKHHRTSHLRVINKHAMFNCPQLHGFWNGN